MKSSMNSETDSSWQAATAGLAGRRRGCRASRTRVSAVAADSAHRRVRYASWSGSIIGRLRVFTTPSKWPIPAARCCTAFMVGLARSTGLRTIVDVNSIIATLGHTGNPGNLRGAAYTPPLNNQTLFRRDAYLCLYCGARFTYSLLSRDHVTPFSRGGHGYLEQRGVRLPPLQQRQGFANSGAGRHAASRGAVHADLRGVHFPEGPAGARGSDGVSARAFSALQPPARAHATLADVNGGWVGRSGARLSHRRQLFRFQAYYSMPPDMVDGDGNATHALYGFARFISDFMEQVRPERIGVAFDQSLRSETSFRCGIYPAYKANREAPPADLKRQFCAVPRILPAYGARGIRERGIRSRRHHRHFGGPSPRRRALQRAGDSRQGSIAAHPRRRRVLGLQRQYSLSIPRDRGALRRESRTRSPISWRSRAMRWTTFPGCPASAKRPPAELFAIFGSLDELYANLEKLPTMKLRGAAAVAAKLLAHKEAAYLARRLTGIVCDVPLGVTLDDLKPRPPDSAAPATSFSMLMDSATYCASKRGESRRHGRRQRWRS